MFLSKNAGHDVAQLILLSASSSVALANSEAAKAKMLAEEGLANTKWCSDLGQKKPIKKRFSFGVKKPMCLKKKVGKINTTLESRSITCTKAPGSLNSSPCEDLLRYVASWSSQRGPASKLSPPEIRFIKALISGQWWPITPYIINKPFFLVVVVLMGVVRRAMIASVWPSSFCTSVFFTATGHDPCVDDGTEARHFASVPRHVWYKGSFLQQCRFNHNCDYCHTSESSGPDSPSKYLWYTKYLCMLTLIYVWLSTCTYAGMCIFTLYTHCPANRSPTMTFLSKIPQICARFDHAKAPGSGKAQDGDLRGHNLFVGGKLELGSLFSFSATAGSSSCSCWFARAMHNWVSRTWMQLKLLARRCLFFPQS